VPLEFDRSRLTRVGAIRVDAALTQGDLRRLIEYCAGIDNGRPGERIGDVQSLGWLLDDGIAGAIARAAIGPQARPVRAIFFDKTNANNWALGWHQDRTIAVENRIELPGFSNWNMKAGVHHVEPPFEYIERMVTARIHLDAVDKDNAPLLIVPGSHCLGRIVEAGMEAIVDDGEQLACLAKAGDIWLYHTAIVHASKRAQGNNRRRVIQVDFSADQLPGSLRWAA
jgi:hypothetical protein